jgi:hypothetical protein
MVKIKIFLFAALAASLFSSCARMESTSPNENTKRFFDAWIKLHHPTAVRDGLGIYILEETTGTGKSAGDAEDFPYAYVSYTISDLDGNISATTDANVAKQLGTYDPVSNYYGPVIRMRNSTAMTAGQEMVLNPMRVGGTRKAAIPGWFNTTNVRYDTEEKYLKNVTGDDVILDLKLHDVISDLTKWQLDSIYHYILLTYHHPVDSLKYGFYYIQTQAPTDTNAFDSNTTVYINYTGQLLNGTVFDTTDEITAKDAEIFNGNKSYEPLKVTMATEYTDIKFSTGSGEANFVDGVSYCLSKMRTGEKGTCIFYSDLGYKSTSQGNIPAFSPLRFDIEMIGKDKK